MNRVNADDCLNPLDIADKIGVSLVKYHGQLERVVPAHHARVRYQPTYARRD